MMFDALRHPALHFRLDPSNGPRADAHPAGEPALRFELVDHRATESRDPADLRQAKYLCRQQGRGERILKC